MWYLCKTAHSGFGLCLLLCVLGRKRSVLGTLCRDLAFQPGNGARLLFLSTRSALGCLSRRFAGPASWFSGYG